MEKINQKLNHELEMLEAVLSFLDNFRDSLNYRSESIKMARNAVYNKEYAKECIQRDIETMADYRLRLLDCVISGTFPGNIPEDYKPIIKQEIIDILRIC